MSKPHLYNITAARINLNQRTRQMCVGLCALALRWLLYRDMNFLTADRHDGNAF